VVAFHRLVDHIHVVGALFLGHFDGHCSKSVYLWLVGRTEDLVCSL
jgi:hypothetical protein